MRELAGEIGGKVDILDQHRRVSSHRTASRIARHRDRARRDGRELLRPAASRAGVRPGDAGPRRRRRGAARPRGSICCRSTRSPNLPPHGTFSAVEGRGLVARAMPARRDAAARHPRRQRLPRPDRRRMEPDRAAAEGRAGGAGQRHRRARCSEGIEDVYPRRRRAGHARRAGATIPRRSNARLAGIDA